MWVLWVPVSEQRDDVGYTDKAVELEARTDKKTPTSRNIQELKEQMVFTEDDINLFDATGIEVPGPVPARPVLAASTASTTSKRRGNTRRGNARSGSEVPAGTGTAEAVRGTGESGHANIVVEAAKHKKNTVKEPGLGQGRTKFKLPMF